MVGVDTRTGGPIAVKLSLSGRRNPMPSLTRAFRVTESPPPTTPTEPADTGNQLESRPKQLARGPVAVLHAVLDSVVDDYLRVADAVEEDVEEIETHVFAVRGVPQVERIYELKRDLIEMKRSIAPLHLPLRLLAERQRDKELRQYFLDVHDHFEQVRQQVANFDELMSSILRPAVARLSVSENEDMRKISAWVAIAAVPTMIAGSYGMNFEFMPELGSPWGYPAIIAVMVTFSSLMYRNFRRQRWL